MHAAITDLCKDAPRYLCDMLGAGEVSLTGRVLPIGGVKEKLLAARRSGVKTVIFPRTNERDYKELTGTMSSQLDCLKR